MTRFSANLGYLWTELPLPDAIRAAAAADFEAVECHWPYDTPTRDVRAALLETGMPMISLNTRRGNVAQGEMGLAAVPGREDDARGHIAESVAYAAEIGASAVHVLAGLAQGPEAERTYFAALTFASDLAWKAGLTILIEPLNRHDAPGYFLSSTEQAITILSALARSNVRLLFDCYHVARTGGDVVKQLQSASSCIGHVQFAGVPDRGPPDLGTVDYKRVFSTLDNLGWDGPLGAEYRPGLSTEASLSWMASLR